MNIERLLTIARNEIGVKADAGKWEDSAGRIRQYRQAIFGPGYEPDRDPEPWCADFVSWCFLQAGSPLGPMGDGFAYTPYLMEWIDGIGWRPPFPQPGDIVILDLNKNGVADHCGIIEEVHPDHLVVIEGNYSDSVDRVKRDDFEHVIMYGRLP